jgi:uncharacterized membrane protein
VNFITKPAWLRSLDARPRLLFSIGMAVLVFILLPHWLRLATRTLITWNAGTVCFLIMALLMMNSATPEKMWRSAQHQDEGRYAILALVVGAASASFLAIVFMLKDTKGLSVAILTLHVALAILTVVCSWLLTHTMFSLHYAHGYYRDKNTTVFSEVEGALDFPNEKQPDYWDFLYFSYVIGMTSQVSDVQVKSRSMRRLALVHGILSFFFNTVILALSINIIAGII